MNNFAFMFTGCLHFIGTKCEIVRVKYFAVCLKFRFYQCFPSQQVFSATALRSVECFSTAKSLYFIGQPGGTRV